MNLTPGSLDRTIDNLSAALFERRYGDHWKGRLSSNALSTACAVIALQVAAQAKIVSPAGGIEHAIAWLVEHQNADGGWGDTVRSISNLSTTSLCWAALSAANLQDQRVALAIDRAEFWIVRAVGTRDPGDIADDILRASAKDQTFSVPVLPILALAGRLGLSQEGWATIPQSPVESAALPHQIRWPHLSVLSYALGALEALSHIRHDVSPSRSMLLVRVREAAISRAVRLLLSNQPNGGLLEAIPLTSFVVIALVAAGRELDPVVSDGVRFLASSAREDGAWPIDTNLATRVTALSLNAVLPSGSCSGAERRAHAEWLLAQQLRTEHPVTHAQPGGWASTDLSGGVPDAESTSIALLALRHLDGNNSESRAAVDSGIEWLLDTQNADGGIPTFCRGAGALTLDRSAPDLTAHALQAWNAWDSALSTRLQSRLTSAARKRFEVSRCGSARRR